MLVRAPSLLCSPLPSLGASSSANQNLSIPIRPLSSLRGFKFSSSSCLCECTNDKHHQSEVTSKAEAFIFDKVNDVFSNRAGIAHQIVLLTAGEDHIPCRLPCPPMTVIFQVSSHPVVQAHEVPKSSLVRYINEHMANSEAWIARLRNAGYQGTKGSVWVIQGIHLETDVELKEVLTNVGSLQIQGGVLIGVVNVPTGQMLKDSEKLMEKILLGCGFRLRSVLYTTARDGTKACILFAAEHLCLSDDQLAAARKEMELAEESGDEDSFEDWI